jgi:hypothetical protein
LRNSIVSALLCLAICPCVAQSVPFVDVDRTASQAAFPIVANGRAAAIYIAPQNPETVRVAAEAFAADVEQVTGVRPRVLESLKAPLPQNLIIVGVLGKSPEIDRLGKAKKIDASSTAGKWESAVTSVVAAPLPGVRRALVIAGSDRRGAAYALFALSRQMGVSPWTWWADVPVAHHDAVYVRAGRHVQPEPSVQYRGIFLNDEDWGLRPWAAKKMDPAVDSAGGNGQPAKGNIGPNTYEKIFELLLRLHANSLWPAMHPGSLAFNAVPENAKLADKWGIVMGSSHSEALLRNNVGEWSEKATPAGDGPWNYQTNAAAMNAYWDKRLVENGKYENFYTVGLRGVHDSGLEATGTPEVKAKLVEDAMAAQRKLLAARVNPDVAKVPQILWLYKESLDLYRVGMQVPDDVTLGWTDDNYGYIRELPDAAEQKRAGGSGVYYHVSYWGSPHDYLWLCTTPPALIQEEMTKAYDHNARKYWILNVGDLKPAELDIDYFMQLATDEPAMAKLSQREWLTQWFAQQFPTADAAKIADVMTRYYALNFIRKPEFMGFNGYNDGIQRTEFNPYAWGLNGVRDQNRTRLAEWEKIRKVESSIAVSLPNEYSEAFFELVGYPVEASAGMNEKLLWRDRSFVDIRNPELIDSAMLGPVSLADQDGRNARFGYNIVQSLTAIYNSIDSGKWDGIMSDTPRERHVFEMPKLATAADADAPLPASWGAGSAACQKAADPAPSAADADGFAEQHCTVSINVAHFTRKFEGATTWNVLADLGISGDSMVYGAPGVLANTPMSRVGLALSDMPRLEYDFTTSTRGPATLALHLLPTFPLDSDRTLRYAVALDKLPAIELDAAAGAASKSAGAGDGPSGAAWSANVLRNSAIATVTLGTLAPGKHTLRLYYREPGVVFQHLVITFPGAPPAYPVPPETR